MIAESARRSAAGNAFKLGTSMAVVLLLGLFMRAYMPRNLGAELMGQFYFAESFPAMFFSVLPLGIFAYIQRTIPGNAEHARDVFHTILVFELVFALLILAVVTASLAALGYDSRMLFLGAAMGVYAAAGTLIRAVLKPLLLSLEAVNLVAWIEVLAKTLQVALIVLVLWETSSLVFVVSSFAVVEAATVAVLVLAVVRRGAWQGGFKASVLKTVVTSSLPFFLMNVFLMVYNNLDQTLLSRLVNDAEVGFYGAASRRWRPEIRRGVLLGVGMAIAFQAGTRRRAPRWMQVSGTEWLFRLLQEPRRLARRYLGDVAFFRIALRRSDDKNSGV